MPAADVCRALAVDGSSGVLEIEGPDGRGTVVYDRGDIVAAGSPTPRARLGDRLVSAGLLDEDDLAGVLRSQSGAGEGRPLGSLLVAEGLVTEDAVRVVAQEQVIDAVFDVVGWPYGAFRFDHDGESAAPPAIPVRFAVDDLLVEVSRRHEEWADVRRVIPDLDAVPAFRAGASSAQAALEPDEFTLLASIDGERSVRELADDLGYGHFEAARIVYGLALLGVVEVTLPEDEVGRALEEALRSLSHDEHADAAETEAPVVDADQLDVSALLAELEADPIRGDADPMRGDADPMRGDADPIRDAGFEVELEVERSADQGPPAPEPPLTPGEPVGTSTPPETPAAAGAPDPSPDAEDPPARADGREVAELLRELSRMALEDPEGPEGPPAAAPDARRQAAPPPPRRDAGKDDPPRRRRLFGRG
jgi:hypothetical protein